LLRELLRYLKQQKSNKRNSRHISINRAMECIMADVIVSARVAVGNRFLRDDTIGLSIGNWLLDNFPQGDFAGVCCIFRRPATNFSDVHQGAEGSLLMIVQLSLNGNSPSVPRPFEAELLFAGLPSHPWNFSFQNM
jgi:hypothetical protein